MGIDKTTYAVLLAKMRNIGAPTDDQVKQSINEYMGEHPSIFVGESKDKIETVLSNVYEKGE